MCREIELRDATDAELRLARRLLDTGLAMADLRRASWRRGSCATRRPRSHAADRSMEWWRTSDVRSRCRCRWPEHDTAAWLAPLYELADFTAGSMLTGNLLANGFMPLGAPSFDTLTDGALIVPSGRWIVGRTPVCSDKERSTIDRIRSALEGGTIGKSFRPQNCVQPRRRVASPRDAPRTLTDTHPALARRTGSPGE
jgi:hypothetical protein